MILHHVRFIASLLAAFIVVAGTPAVAQEQSTGARPPHLSASLLAEDDAPAPGGSTTLAIRMEPEPGWHGYWANPGDAGTPPAIDWTLPDGVTIGSLRYPVPQKLVISGLMNHVYEHVYALLAKVNIAADMAPGTPIAIRGEARWLVCSDTLCVPEDATLTLTLTVGAPGKTPKVTAQFDGWRSALPRPLGTTATFDVTGDNVRLAIPFPASATITDPHFFALSRDMVDYAKPQSWSRNGDMLIVAIPKAPYYEAADRLEGVLATGSDSALELVATRGTVPPAGTPIDPASPQISGFAPGKWIIALGGAILGGVLLNLMPCVFPILSLKAISLIRAGGSEHHARIEGLAYTAGAIIGTSALGGVILALRAAGASAGWAFQLQYPATILTLLAIMALMTANLAGWFTLPPIRLGQSLAGKQGHSSAFFTGGLAAFVATPCTGPFMGAALGAALVLPGWAAMTVFAGLGLGVGLPFLALGLIPALRRRLPRPGGWMERLKHWLAVPMALTTLALLWLLWRQTGLAGLGAGLGVLALLALLATRQNVLAPRFAPVGLWLAASIAAGFLLNPLVGQDNGRSSTAIADARPFSDSALATLRQAGKPVFLYFTADWCVTCKVNEAAAINRAEVAAHFKATGTTVMIGDWTRGDAAITRFLESHGRSGVPLYLFYPAQGAPQVLPQLLTPDLLLGLGR